MDTLRATYVALAPFFLLYAGALSAEWALLAWRGRAAGVDGREVAANIASWLSAMAAWIPINIATFGTAWWLWQFRIFDLGAGPGAWVVAVLAWDLSFYWQHRAEHEIRLLWAGHVTHHSGEHFNFATGFRQSWTPWTGFLFFPAWALLGVRPDLIFIAGGWNLVYQFFLHTELIPKLPRWIESWANTPSHHRVHHASNPVYWDHNYGGALIVWDRLFGTFVAEREAPVYGISPPLRSWNPVWIQLHEYVAIARDWRAATGWRERVASLVRQPVAARHAGAPAGDPRVAGSALAGS